MTVHTQIAYLRSAEYLQHWICENVYIRTRQAERERRHFMKGYNTEQGYYGWWQGEYILFASEADYRDAMEKE